MQINITGTGCNYNSPCSLNQPITFTPSTYSYTLQACDTVAWTFGDGGTATTTGTTAATHTFTTAGSYQASATVSNSLGSAISLSPSFYVANGFVGLSPLYAPNFSENAGSATLNVSRSNSSGPATVNYATSDPKGAAGIRYTATSGTLSFAAGESTKAIAVPLINTSTYEGDTYFNVTLTTGTGGYLVPADNYYPYYATVQVGIHDDETPPTFAFDQSSYTVAENAGSLQVRVNRTGDMTRTVTASYYAYVNCCSQVFSNYSGQVTFLPNVAQTVITLQLVNNDVYEGDRNGSLQLSLDYNSGATFGPPYYGTYASVSVTVTDDEAKPDLIVDDVNLVEGNSGLKNAVFTVRLTSKLNAYYDFSWSTSDGTARSGSDYNARSNGASIPSGATSTTITVPVIGDTAVEPNETFSVRVSPYYSSANQLKPTGICTILNDDASLSPATLSIAKGSTSSLLVDIGQPTNSAPTLTLSSSDRSVATVPPTLTLSSAGARFEVPVTGVAAGSAVISVGLPAALGGGTLTASIGVYEGANLVFAPKSISAPIGSTTTISVSAEPPLTAPLFVALSVLDGSIADVGPSVTIPAGGSATFTVKGLKAGATSLRAQLPPQNGAVTLYVAVNVAEAPSTPSLTGVQPASGPIAGGTNVTVDGAKLSPDCTLSFGGAPATNVGFVSGSSITATTPAHAAGSVDVSLNCSGATSTLTNAFTYVSSGATISGVTPSFGSTEGGTYVRIGGSSFAPGCWPFFDGNPARGAVMKSASEIIATSAAHAAGSVDVSLRCGSSTVATLANAFTYNAGAEPSPVITSVDPLAGSSGQSVTVSGARFAAGDRVTFDTAAATILSFAPDALTVRVPDLPLGKTSITVTDGAGHASTTGPIFTVTEPFPPQITSATPTTLRAGGELTLDGSAFRPGYSFAIGDAKATTISMTYKRVVIRVPDVAAANYPVNILNAAGQVASVGPTITISSKGVMLKSITPGCATSDGGISVTIAGSGFESGASVAIDGVSATNVKVVDAQTITATLPAGSPGSPVVMVTNANGDRGTLTGALQEFSPFDPNGICGAKHRGARH
jgi:hypothetical protein